MKMKPLPNEEELNLVQLFLPYRSQQCATGHLLEMHEKKKKKKTVPTVKMAAKITSHIVSNYRHCNLQMLKIFKLRPNFGCQFLIHTVTLS